MTRYQARVLEQSAAWVHGICRHNKIDNECCPDFSCCKPALFERDREKRIESHNQLRTRYGLGVRHDG